MKKLFKKRASVLVLVLIISILALSTFITNVHGAAYNVDYKIQNDWGAGANVSVTITNTGTSAINGWSLAWTFSGNQKISTLWNGSFTQNGTSVTIKDAGYNSTIPANSSVTFGFSLTYSGSNSIPTNITLNGSTSSNSNAPTSSTVVTSTAKPTSTATKTPVTTSTSTSTSTGTEQAQITLSNNTATITGTGATASGSKVTINSAGKYTISGTLTNGQIIVDTTSNEKVELALNGANITCQNSSPINVKNGETIISLNGNNTVTDGTSYVYDDTAKEEPSAAIFSKDDLTIKGNGSLTVKGNFNDGITCKDDLKISNGTINVTSKDDGLVGKESVEVNGGNITINAQSDGIKSTEDKDPEKGTIQIDGGTIDLTAGDDGINAYRLFEMNDGILNISVTAKAIRCDTEVLVNNGTINITKCREGVESQIITFNNGTTTIDATDDSTNASKGGRTMQDDGSQLNINGGTLYVSSSEGDPLDSNGTITIKGGTVVVHGPTTDFEVGADSNGEFTVSGGTLIMSGTNSFMTQYPTGASSQYSMAFMLTQSQAANSILCIKDSSGKELVKFKPKRSYYSFVFSSPDIKNGATYNLLTGGTVSGGTDTFGLITGGTYNGGTSQASLTINQSPTTTSGNFGGGMWNGGNFGGGNWGGGNWNFN